MNQYSQFVSNFRDCINPRKPGGWIQLGSIIYSVLNAGQAWTFLNIPQKPLNLEIKEKKTGLTHILIQTHTHTHTRTHAHTHILKELKQLVD